MERRPEEWNQLVSQAMLLLEHPERLPDQTKVAKHQLILRLWHYPSFGSYTVWLVYGPSRRYENLPPLVREAIWDRPGDAERFSNPMEGLKRGFHSTPYLGIRDAEMSLEVFNNYLKELASINLPPFIGTNSIVLDGEIFGIEAVSWLNNGRLLWWCEGPQEWKPVIAWFARITDFFKSELFK